VSALGYLHCEEVCRQQAARLFVVLPGACVQLDPSLSNCMEVLADSMQADICRCSAVCIALRLVDSKQRSWPHRRMMPACARARRPGGAQVDVCKLVPTFPRSMSACVRECFSRLGAMDPELRGRLSDWLAYHLSNFEFMWPWDKWRAVLDAPPHNAQRRAPPPPCCAAASRVQGEAGRRCVHAAWRHCLALGSVTCTFVPG